MSEPIRFIDGHNDTLLRLLHEETCPAEAFLNGCEQGHIDLPRATGSGMKAGFYAIFPSMGRNPKWKSSTHSKEAVPEGYRYRPYPPMNHSDAVSVTHRAIHLLDKIINASAGKIRLIRDTEDLNAVIQGPQHGGPEHGIILHFEGAEAIDMDLNALPVYYRAGLRSLGLVWSRPNAFGSGVPFACPQSPDVGSGLTIPGCELVQACNDMGIMLDLAHLNERGFNDVARLSKHPLVSTHTAVHAIAPTARNLTDRQLDVIADSGGIVGCNFYVGDLVGDGRDNTQTPISKIVEHTEYLIKRIGIDHVALGSDFDGATMSDELKDVTGYPKVFDQLRERGYDREQLDKIAWKNWQRVLHETWK